MQKPHPSDESLNWRPLTQRTAARIPSSVRSWLVDRDSLTRQVKRACNDAFSVRVLQQHWKRAGEYEVAMLGISAGDLVIVREVQLLCGSVPWVFARSLIPRAALRGHYAVLGQMGERPLGEKLFADPIMVRGDVEYTSLQRGTRRYHRALTDLDERPTRIFGRRSLFTGARAPVMVMEFFLPSIGGFPTSALTLV